MFKSLTTHEIPMVRKFASKGLGGYLKVLLPNQEKEILDMVNNVIKDDQDLVRIYMVDALIPLAGLLAPQKHAQILIPMFNTLADDQSWRIKYAICEKCQEVKKIKFLYFF
jgi:serine/threonine-protein phosphatase 2A regulatory subunit A